MIFSNYCSDSKKKIRKNTRQTHSCDDERIVAPSSDSSSSHSHSSDEKLICPKCCAGSSYSEYLRQIKKKDREKKNPVKKFCDSKKRKHESISDEEDECNCEHDRSRSGSDTSITLTKYERVKRRLGLKDDQKYENDKRRLEGDEKNLRHRSYKQKDSGIQCGHEKRIHNSLSPESDNGENRSAKEKSKHHGKRFKSATDAKCGRHSEHRRHNHHHHRSQRYKSVSSSS